MKSRRVTGIGGIFFKCIDKEKLREWYSNHLGLTTDKHGTSFEWRKTDQPDQKGFSVWSPFPNDTKYFEPSQKEFMINFRVQNLESLVESLRKEGVAFVDSIETFEYGKFVHIMDPEGNKIELWEPIDDVFDKMIGNVRTF